MMKFHFSKREQIIFLVTISFLVGYVFYMVIYQPFWEEIAGLRRNIAAAQQDLSKQKVLFRELASRSRIQDPILEGYRQKESDGSVRSKMMAALQEISSQQKVRIADMKPSVVRGEKSYKEFPVSMTLEGEFVDIMRFLYEAESGKYGFHIQEFRFARSYSAKTDLQCQVVLSRIFLREES
jgi:Tfp pilus assembly protein PilO